MKPKTEYQTFSESHAISLGSLCLKETALSRENAVRAIHLLQDSSVAVLGGDVYFRMDIGFESGYANWHSDPREKEGSQAFVARSHREALSYIETFPSGGPEPLFVLITHFLY